MVLGLNGVITLSPHGLLMSNTTPQISTVVTYLEMHARPVTPAPPRPAIPLALLRVCNIPVSFYRYLYETVGEAWFWYERRMIDDATLSTIVHDEGAKIYVIYVDGAPGGYGELMKTENNTVDLAYFGLLPDFIGRGLGRYFLRCMVDHAWGLDPIRITVNTCDLDHPCALKVYQKTGFSVYRREIKQFEDPRSIGILEDWQDPRLNQGHENY